MFDETVQAVEPAAAPVVDPVVDEQAPVAPEVPDDAGQESPEDKPRGGFQRRIKELSDDRNYWRELALRAQPQQPPPSPPKAAEPEVPVKLPRLEDFGFDEAKYHAALLDHVTKQAEAAAERRLQQAEKERAERERTASFAERQASFAKEKPDYVQRVYQDPTLPISPAMRDVIVDSPNGPEVAYWLAEHREDAARIAGLPAHLAAAELGRIEGRLLATREAVTAAKQAPPVTKAPPPPPKVDAAEPDVERDPDSMSIPEWKKWRDKTRKI